MAAFSLGTKAASAVRGPSARVRLGLERNRSTPAELHPERAVSATLSWKETEGLPLFTRRGRMLQRIVAEHPVLIQEGELIVGMKTLTPRGSPVYPEVSCDWVERDLELLPTRANTPFQVSERTRRVLRTEVFPFWKGRQISDRILEAVPAEMWQADERGVIYNYWRSRTIGHINAGYEKVLTLGLEGISADVRASMARLDHHVPQFASKRQFLESVLMACEAGMLLAARYDDIVRGLYAQHCPVPFTSAVVDDCVREAVDWHAGGSHYKIATLSAVAVGTVADALAGIRRHVFESPATTMAGLVEALDRDWEGHELLRQRLVNKTPHYGNDDDAADGLAVRVQDIFCSAVERHVDIQGARYWVDMLPTTSHIALGELTGATPDGRRARAWLSEGVSPVQGHDRRGPTASTRSVAKLDHARTNGTLLNLKISPETVREERDLPKLAALIRGYFAQGGFHMQFNIVDRRVLLEAMARPEEHRNLLIRVAGYSDYFVLLSREIQEEILSRAEHGV